MNFTLRNQIHEITIEFTYQFCLRNKLDHENLYVLMNLLDSNALLLIVSRRIGLYCLFVVRVLRIVAGMRSDLITLLNNLLLLLILSTSLLLVMHDLLLYIEISLFHTVDLKMVAATVKGLQSCLWGYASHDALVDNGDSVT